MLQRFRMRKHVFLRIVGDLSSSDNYFTLRVDTTKKEGISPLAKCTTTMLILAYGVAVDAAVEYIKIGGTTTLECLHRFCKEIIQLYEQLYLIAPTQDDLKRILHHGKVNLLGEIREPSLLFLKQLKLMIYGFDMPFLDVWAH
ncbi:ribosomal protein [Trifolium pratense]|uniref:Ribosomal protein n=1 Tax=Trifolium pratense TaxID=57577 RepID=A0A2K3NI49_TRIPR|nr:ribosomal protein [Trifolium pratense]